MGGKPRVPAFSVPKMKAGMVDPMSRSARLARLVLCAQTRRQGRCTRAAGHDEGHGQRSNADQHVATDVAFRALEVWG